MKLPIDRITGEPVSFAARRGHQQIPLSLLVGSAQKTSAEPELAARAATYWALAKGIGEDLPVPSPGSSLASVTFGVGVKKQ